MKSSRKHKFYLLILLVNLSIFGCSQDDSNSQYDPSPTCFQDEEREIVATLTDAEGTIRGPGTFCPTQFTIEPDLQEYSHPLNSFLPCNLTNEFNVNNARVIFSGYVYESFETEDICASFF